eukprot:TRINITY_DN1463_c0_g1_i1.p1 TRINITY_DN1463_c0_g1~~TRINITY_DN1463_c0_g1_i1.p1  ORF type:complete len:228 (+),score=85.76 TRINITY_DN1463_c0_g1_i1:229-912(+)
MKIAVLVALLGASLVADAQDPASSWLGYAKAVNPTGGDSVVSFAAAKWVVPDNPEVWGAYLTPWFGIETSDNLNLIQPVNPWNMDTWTMYNEYFQWKPVHNENSVSSSDVKAGDVIEGSVTFNAFEQSYAVYIGNQRTHWNTTTKFAVQKTDAGVYKNYTTVYFVQEHPPASCRQYPRNGQVTFYDITIEHDSVQVEPKWSTGFVADACGCRAAVLNSTAVQITWKP